MIKTIKAQQFTCAQHNYTAITFKINLQKEKKLYFFQFQSKKKPFYLMCNYPTQQREKDWRFNAKKVIFYFQVNNHFCQGKMDKEDSYNYSQHQQEEVNLLTSLLNGSSERKQLLNHCDSTHLRVEQFICEEQVEQEQIPSVYRDIMDKQLSNNLLPQNFYQEHGEQSILIMAPQSKKTLPEPQNANKKDSRIDKLTYQEESREAKIQRYRNKKSRRIWGRKVSYDCRKLVADKRQRVNGRFVKKSPLITESHHNNRCQNSDIFQMLQEYHSMHSQGSGNSNFVLE